MSTENQEIETEANSQVEIPIEIPDDSAPSDFDLVASVLKKPNGEYYLSSNQVDKISGDHRGRSHSGVGKVLFVVHRDENLGIESASPFFASMLNKLPSKLEGEGPFNFQLQPGHDDVYCVFGEFANGGFSPYMVD